MPNSKLLKSPTILPQCYWYNLGLKKIPTTKFQRGVLAKPPALVGPGLPLKLPSVLMVTKGKGTRHHRSNTFDFLREDGVEMELRKKNSVVCDTALCYKTWLGTE